MLKCTVNVIVVFTTKLQTYLVSLSRMRSASPFWSASVNNPFHFQLRSGNRSNTKRHTKQSLVTLVHTARICPVSCNRTH